jgi:hypothetical protein
VKFDVQGLQCIKGLATRDQDVGCKVRGRRFKVARVLCLVFGF